MAKKEPAQYIDVYKRQVSMPNDEINRYMKMEKLLENKISRRFKVRRLEILSLIHIYICNFLGIENYRLLYANYFSRRYIYFCYITNICIIRG